MGEERGLTVMKSAHLWLGLVRPVIFVIGTALSLWAVATYLTTAQIVLREPGLILPQEQWSIELLQLTLNRIGLPENFYAIYSLTFALLFSLVFMVCGWLTLLRKKLDWFGFFLTLLLLGWASGFSVFLPLPQEDLGYETIGTLLSWFIWPGLFFLLYFFPSGQVTPRWTRYFAWGWGLFSVYGLVASLLDRLPEIFIFLPMLFSVLGVGGYAQIYRYRHAGALERQQIKWVVTALLIMIGSFTVIALVVNFTGLADPQQSSPTGALVFQIVTSTIGNLAFIGVPISIVMAMLRYRLWDVDVVIRRTLQYTLLSGLLVLTYFGGIVVIQGILGPLTGDTNSPLVTVITTLGIAALFNPLRYRVQDFIDRRFYRKKYDAEKALAQFAATARDEVDMEKLSAALLWVVDETMQPEKVSMWMLRRNQK